MIGYSCQSRIRNTGSGTRAPSFLLPPRRCLLLNGAYPVVGDLESLQVGAGEVRRGQEARRDPVGGERQRRPVKNLLLPLGAQIQHLHGGKRLQRRFSPAKCGTIPSSRTKGWLRTQSMATARSNVRSAKAPPC